ncbi:MAG: hypothetical protein M1831_007599 [Alyxoria varia]|nr:MAG: hypothetical protein M1831_007599 [Alyxoria varia]
MEDPVRLWHLYRETVLILALAAVLVYRVARWLQAKRQAQVAHAERYVRSSDLDTNNHNTSQDPEKFGLAPGDTSKATIELGLKEGKEAWTRGVPERQHSFQARKQPAGQVQQYPRRITGVKPAEGGKRRNYGERDPAPSTGEEHVEIQPLVFFSSITGNTSKQATRFAACLDKSLRSRRRRRRRQQQSEDGLVGSEHGEDDALSVAGEEEASRTEEAKLVSSHHHLLDSKVRDLSYIELDDYFTALPKEQRNTLYFYIVMIPSYDIDTNIDLFVEHLKETHHDFRIDTAPLRDVLGYAVFGFGDKERWPTEEDGFCSQATQVDKWLAKLTSRKRAYPLGMADVKAEDAEKRLEGWCEGVSRVLHDLAVMGRALGEGVPGSGDALESDEEEEDNEGANDADELELEDQKTVEGENVMVQRKKLRSSPFARKKKASRQTAETDDLENIGGVLENVNGFNSIESRQQQQQQQQAQFGPIDFTARFSSKSSRAPPSTTTRTTTTSSNSPPTASSYSNTNSSLKEMVPSTSPTHAALTKQGYTIIGSHSGVKICRWTKSALRGRGHCYKHSFYGIESHLCMETTPSLSCSNKCVFCWRHGTNPVGTTWRWKVDPPDVIFKGAKEGHYKKIKMMRGVPGVRAERFEQAMRIRHCALSLVGEPIFYPHINQFVGLLHAERISSFLVCNAQHPEQLAALQQVTQLYVSIDASNAESLRRIDRPLHRDFWDRFCRCLDILRDKRFEQRTVFRLTLVKGFNVEEEAEGYARLVERGLPCFVEVKGVTYCGTSSSNSSAGGGLTMQNVPFYHEVKAFVEALNSALAHRSLPYGIAAEHEHSCCVLLASSRFQDQETGAWRTRIDYERFFELLEGGHSFAPEDYAGTTEEWALYGRGGFDPNDERMLRKRHAKADE